MAFWQTNPAYTSNNSGSEVDYSHKSQIPTPSHVPPPPFSRGTDTPFMGPPQPLYNFPLPTMQQPISPSVPLQFYPFVPPPLCNTSVPPPLASIMSQPPIPRLADPQLPHVHPTKGLEDEYEMIRIHLEEKFKKFKRTKKTKTKIQVSSIKEKFVKCYGYIAKLENLTKSMQLSDKSLPDDQWLDFCKDVNKVKDDLSEIFNEINSPEILANIKKSLHVRRRKREYKTRKLRECQEQKRQAKIHREQEHRRIDLWLEKMKDQVARAKREEDIKREADLVLSDVTAKKAEAKKMLSFLNSLSKLRSSRALNVSAGKSVSETENMAFNEIIDRLKKMWLDQFNGYKVEEEGLKVMLSHAEEERESIETMQIRRNLKAWSRVIFGSSSSTQVPSVEELIQVRKDWDQFICFDNAPMASNIPIGWILPSEPTSKEWSKYL